MATGSGSGGTVAWPWDGSGEQGDGQHSVVLTATDSTQLWTLAQGALVLDTAPPTVTVSAPDVAALHFRVSWQGADAHTGLSHYDVGYKVGSGGAWTGWLTETDQTSAFFIGEADQTYYFRAQATDSVSNTSAWIETGPVTIEAVRKNYHLGGQLVATRRGDEVYFIHGDHLGSTSLTTNISGTLVAQTRYLPYGEERWTAGGAQPTDFTFTGQRAERGFGLMDFKARHYNSRLGRFISPDSIVPEPGNPQSLNRYSYVLNRPLQGGDPTGHQGPIDWNLEQHTPPAEYSGSVVSVGMAGGVSIRIPGLGRIGLNEHVSFDFVSTAEGQVQLFTTFADKPQSGLNQRVRGFIGKEDTSHRHGKTADAIAADSPYAPFTTPQWGWFLTQGVLEGEIKDDVSHYAGPATVKSGGGSLFVIGPTGSFTESFDPETGASGEVKGTSVGLAVGLSWPSEGGIGASAAEYGTYSYPAPFGPIQLGEPGLFVFRKLGQCGSGTFDPTPIMRSY